MHATAVRPSDEAGGERGARAARVALGMILGLAALLRGWHLSEAGFGSPYYAAGVLSMLRSWHNFWFNSFDPGGFVSIDKPPLALWLQVASAKIFGFSGWSIHLPQMIEGVVAVALLYYLVRRRFGRPAGLLAALFLALTPISVAVDRSNNTDSCLALALLAAAWAAGLAAESGSRRMLLVSMLLVGVAFNVKMLAAAVVVPAFMAAYFLGAPLPLGRRWAHLLLATAVLTVVSLAWCVAYDLTPAQSRPYVGSTRYNSMLELVVGENGVRRFVARQRFGGPGPGARQAAPPPTNPAAPTIAAPARNAGAPSGLPAAFGFAAGTGDRVPIGPFRLVHPLLADQMGWLYPLVLVGIGASLWRRRPSVPLEPCDSALVLWGGWLLVYGLVLSFAGGIFHAYYLVAMAPPVCALAAIGLVRLWGVSRETGRRALALSWTLLAVVTWEIYISHGYLAARLSALPGGVTAPAALGQLTHITYTLIAVSGVAAVLACALLGVSRSSKSQLSQAWSRTALGLGIFALTVIPGAWAFGSMLTGNNGNFVNAQPPSLAPARFARGRDQPTDARLIAFLTEHYDNERFLLATLNAQQAAPIILATGKAVMAMGGFAGADPILTPAALGGLVQQHAVRFVLIGAGGGAGFVGRGPPQQSALIEWVRGHGTAVAPALWQSSPRLPRAGARPRYFRGNPRARGPGGRGFNAMVELFDLRPDAASSPAPLAYQAEPRAADGVSVAAGVAGTLDGQRPSPAPSHPH